MALRLITPPAVEPLTPAEVRTRLGLDATVTDGMLTPLIKAARQSIDGPDGILRRAINTQTWDLVFDEWPTDAIQIPLPPLQAIVSVIYVDADGDEQTVSAADYVADAQINRGWLVYASTFTSPSLMDTINAVRIRFRAGYGDAGSDVPEPIRQAIALGIGQMRTLTSGSAGLRREAIEGVGSWDYGGGESSITTISRASKDLLWPYMVLS